MKFNKSYLIAGLALLVIGVWFAVNAGSNEDAHNAAMKNAETARVDARNKVENALPTVVVERRESSEHTNAITLFGRTEANREVAVKAETSGLVVRTPIREGASVKRGTVICRQDVDARQANLDQAKANLQARQVEFNANSTLVEKGFRSETSALSAQAALDGAKAAVKQAEIELDNVNMRAPFAGIFEKQMAEIGDYLGPGQACGLLMELSPLIVIVELTEPQIGFIKDKQQAEVKLATGETLIGDVRFIEAKANPATRTFRTEIALPNEDYKLKAGVTATVRIQAGTTRAQHIPSKILTLADNGNVGVRYIDAANIVRFTEVTTIDEDSDGIWVTGLPNNTRIIVQGQDFVAEGTEVLPTITTTMTRVDYSSQ